jgi:hypothetical protein
MRKKNPKYKKQDLINTIVEKSCKGVLQPEIINWLMTEGECKISYCYDLLRESKPIIQDTLKDLSKDRLEKTIADLEQMMWEAKKAGDKKLALEIYKEINKITGMGTQKVDITTGGDKINQISVIRLIEIKNENDKDENIEGEV